MSADAEEVVLLDEQGRPIGRQAKATVHHRHTPLHLAFSCYLFDAQDRLLVTRRAIDKLTWPGVWTNSCCGHPAPGEDPADAVRRRVSDELGLQAADLRLALPDFRYRAVAADGTVENEVCPVYVGRAPGDPTPDPREVMDWHWVSWADFAGTAARTPWAISPWAALQVPALVESDAGPPTEKLKANGRYDTKGRGWTVSSTSS